MSFSEDQNHNGQRLTTIRFIFLLVLFSKGWERFFYSGIWAEDGSLFLAQAFEFGWLSLSIPYDGYLHLVPRIIALVSTWLPVKLIPYFIVFTCYTIFACMITLFFTPPYRWVFRTRLFTFIAALLLLVTPGQIEMLGNLTNLHWYLLFLLSVLGLKDLETGYRVWEVIIALLCISTSGATLILLPLFVLRLIIKWRQQKGNQSGEICIVLAILLFSVINAFLSAGSSLFYYPFGIYFKIFINHFLHFFVFHIFAGDQLTMGLHHYKNIAYLGAIIIALFVSLQLRTNWEQKNLLVIILCLCSLLLPVMIAMARPVNVLTLMGYNNYDMFHWFRSRYSFYIPAIAIIFWMFFISRVERPKWVGLTMILLILFSQIFLNIYRFPVTKYKHYYGWRINAELLEQSLKTGCPKILKVPIDPKGWYFAYKSPLEADCSGELKELK